MDISDYCRSRVIGNFKVQSPLLIPSFSSRGFDRIEQIHAAVRDYLVDVSLVSAYDLYYHDIQEPDIDVTNVLFVDSGGYEARPTVDVLDPYWDEKHGRSWTLDHYEGILHRLDLAAHVVVVSFDRDGYVSMSEQISAAGRLFSKFPAFASDFLCKPDSPSERFVGFGTLIDHIESLASFDVIGLTEKELGPTLLKRCAGLLQFRRALLDRGYDNPIHVFGCLEPATMLAYYLCGADIFDGLAWLRFGFRDGISTAHQLRLIDERTWGENDEDALLFNRVNNLDWLTKQRLCMHDFAKAYDPQVILNLGLPLEKIRSLVLAAGLRWEV